jgi:diguanylate cyclase (GGDEF)-like protein/PAS domain S-box-containing protein
VDPRRWWLLAGVAPALVACAVAASTPALRPLGDVAVAVSGVLVAALIWFVAGRKPWSRRSWRLLAIAPTLSVAGAALAAAFTPADPLDQVILRWSVTAPGYLIAIIAILSLVDRGRLVAAGARLAVEATLFTSAGLVVVQTLTIGSAQRWTSLGIGEQAVLTGALLVTSATMAAALTLLGAIEPQRQPMALVLLCGAVLLTAGRGLGTSAHLWGAATVEDLSRFLLSAGLWLLAAAVVVDPGPAAAGTGGLVGGRSTELGQTLPHLAMLVAAAVLGAVLLSGGQILPTAIAGMVLCAVLATVHRWVTVGESRRMAARLRRREAYFRSLVRSGSDAVVILDPQLRITAATAALGRVLGAGAHDLVGRPLLDAVHPEDRATLAGALPDSVETHDELAAGLLLLRLCDADGVWRPFEASTTDLRNDPDVGSVVLHCRDMTERLSREQALLSVAYTDPMTGLPNRAGFLRELEVQLDRGDPVDEESILMTIELDGVSAARQQVGREMVTTVMAEISGRLRATVRATDVVARLGGGAFAVLSHGEPGEAERLASRLLSVVEQPLLTAEGVVELTACIGLVTVDGDSVDELFQRADLAVRAARDTGPGSARRYDASLGEAADRRDRIRAALQSAECGDQLFLLFQPIMSLADQRITGLEAQLRWRHPELGEVPPAEFLPVAERSGVIGNLMRWALREAIGVAATLTPAPGADEPLRIGLKIPTGYAVTGTLVPDVEEALRRSDMSPERLVLQISSPTVAVDDERTGLDVTSLRLMGVHVALEGFGSADSALSHLTRWPIDIVKIDRALITRIDRDPQSRALCESVIGIGRALGLDVVAEGVETPAQLAALSSFGCSFAQGFHIARAVAGTGLPALLAQSAETGTGLVGSR